MSKHISRSASPIYDVVMQKISAGEVKMRSRLHFTLLVVTGGIAAVIAGALMIDLIRIITLSWRVMTASTPAYGARLNLSDMVGVFPWWLLLLASIFAAIAIWLLRRYARLYRFRTSTIVLVVLVVCAVLGVAVASLEPSHRSDQPAEQITHGRYR